MVNQMNGHLRDKRWILSLIVMIAWLPAYLPGLITQPIAQAQTSPISDLASGCPSLVPSPLTAIIYLPLIAGPAAVSGGLKLQAPSQGAYHAAFPEFVTVDEEPAPATAEKIKLFESLAGKEIVWAYFSNEWTNGIYFPKEDVCTIHNSGKVPFVRLMPYNRDTEFKELHDCIAPPGFEPAYKMQDFIEGDYDEPLRQWAREAKATGVPILAQFGVEVNGCWFSWNGQWQGGSQTNGYGDPALADGPERFRDAYRHVIDLFRAEGANNITWFFHINYDSSPGDSWNHFANYYPGDDYIDWIGVSIYGAQDSDAAWYTFNELFQGVYNDLNQTAVIARTKPVAVLEMGVTEDHPTGVKSVWITEALTIIRAGTYPRLKGISWWQEKWTNSDGSVSDLRINSSPASQAAYQQGIASNFFVTQPAFASGSPSVTP
ncbi:MAG: hypothetical protein HYR94_17155 [Chloroflexi bacterium]|nr:hypothetical protein [Chloroflexota bacterium]